jgi:hypothetical protein
MRRGFGSRIAWGDAEELMKYIIGWLLGIPTLLLVVWFVVAHI